MSLRGLICASSVADLSGLAYVLAVRGWDCRLLYLLAQRGNVHCLPSADTLHNLVELLSRASGVHIALNVGVELGSLLENANAVVVLADAVVSVVQRRRYGVVGQDLDARL